MSTRDAARTFAAAFSATLVLTGCGREPTADAPPAPTESAAPSQRWEAVASDEGTAIALLGEGDTQLFHLACLNGPSRMAAIAQPFLIVASEERLTLGVGDEAYALVVDTQSDQPGVRGEAVIDEGLLSRLAAAGEIEAVYGTQRAGPYALPDAETLAAFIEGCRAIAREGAAA